MTEGNGNDRAATLNILGDQFMLTIRGVRELLEAATPHVAPLDETGFLSQQTATAIGELSPEKRAELREALRAFIKRDDDEGLAPIDQSDAHEGEPSQEPATGEDSEGSSPGAEISEELRPRAGSGTKSGPTAGPESPGDPGSPVDPEAPAEPESPREPVASSVGEELSMGERAASVFGDDFAGYMSFMDDWYSGFIAPAKLDLLHRSLLTTAVAAFESLFAGLAARHYEYFPGTLETDEKEFSLRDLGEFESIADARQAAIDRRVDNLMRESLMEWDKWLKKRISFAFADLGVDSAAIQEVFERRHIVVHNGGRVSRLYLQRVADPPPGAILGAELRVDAEYLARALDVLNVLGLALMLVCWDKWVPEARDGTGRELLQYEVQLLSSLRWQAACDLAEVGELIELDGYSQEANRVNRWIALKHMVGVDTIRKDVEQWDNTALSRIFTVAQLVLLDDHDAALPEVSEMIRTGDVTVHALREWPLFMEFREDPRYDELIESLRESNGERQRQESEGETRDQSEP